MFWSFTLAYITAVGCMHATSSTVYKSLLGDSMEFSLAINKVKINVKQTEHL